MAFCDLPVKKTGTIVMVKKAGTIVMVKKTGTVVMAWGHLVFTIFCNEYLSSLRIQEGVIHA